MMMAISLCKYCVGRSLITKCVDADEVGKIFSAMGIIGAICPMVSSPLFKKLYNATLDTNPAIFHFVAGGMYLVREMKRKDT